MAEEGANLRLSPAIDKKLYFNLKMQKAGYSDHNLLFFYLFFYFRDLLG